LLRNLHDVILTCCYTTYPYRNFHTEKEDA